MKKYMQYLHKIDLSNLDKKFFINIAIFSFLNKITT